MIWLVLLDRWVYKVRISFYNKLFYFTFLSLTHQQCVYSLVNQLPTSKSPLVRWFQGYPVEDGSIIFIPLKLINVRFTINKLMVLFCSPFIFSLYEWKCFQKWLISIDLILKDYSSLSNINLPDYEIT